jgi:hypothetical protein
MTDNWGNWLQKAHPKLAQKEYDRAAIATLKREAKMTKFLNTYFMGGVGIGFGGGFALALCRLFHLI